MELKNIRRLIIVLPILCFLTLPQFLLKTIKIALSRYFYTCKESLALKYSSHTHSILQDQLYWGEKHKWFVSKRKQPEQYFSKAILIHQVFFSNHLRYSLQNSSRSATLGVPKTPYTPGRAQTYSYIQLLQYIWEHLITAFPDLLLSRCFGLQLPHGFLVLPLSLYCSAAY